jgi:hypothetical protein
MQTENKRPGIIESIRLGAEGLFRGCLVIPLIAALAIIGLKMSRESFENDDNNGIDHM